MYIPIEMALIAARDYFNKGELQIQKDTSTISNCFYSAPCAIGAVMPVELRSKCDEPRSFDTKNEGPLSVAGLIAVGILDTDNKEDLTLLQMAHDSFDLDIFESTLVTMEERHGLRNLA